MAKARRDLCKTPLFAQFLYQRHCFVLFLNELGCLNELTAYYSKIKIKTTLFFLKHAFPML